ncbi:hypothetical protein SAR116_0625 [Candidatus Puniceispirillum marinum IMCC1322]|uniref:DUF2066 domain-containing protein n=2 Tax=Candidatus Puniceispirillum TaxID=767891 RepID=D5BRH1_PUNMI|nr:hypothetical protein SAR116_0625 [Candidatus Puniceispirillum marinum IMCC1322]
MSVTLFSFLRLRADLYRYLVSAFCFRIGFLMSIGLIMTSAANASERCVEPVFGVADIVIDQTADNANAARTKGMRLAAERAFTIVLDRLLMAPERRDAFLQKHDLDEFTDFVHIIEENNLPKRYIGRLDFCFDAQRLRTALKQANLRWSELQSPPILVVPVWNGTDGARAWQLKNKWIGAWHQFVGNNTGLVSFRILRPTLYRERRLRAEDLSAANQQHLASAAVLAEAQQVLLVIANEDYEGSTRLIDVSADLYDSDGKYLSAVFKHGKSAIGKVAGKNDLATIVNRHIVSIAKSMEEGWHAANLMGDPVSSRLTVEVPIDTLTDWASRLQTLRAIAVIDKMEIHKLDITSAIISLQLVGPVTALENALAVHNLQLRMKDDGLPVLTVAQGN